MFGSRCVQVLGPWGLIALGVTAGVMAAPQLRKGARRLAVLAICGALSITDEAKKVAGDVNKVANEARGKLDKLVNEARTVNGEGAATAQD